METTAFQRNCPSCHKILYYRSLKRLQYAEKINSLCLRCNNSQWRQSHPNSKCAICGKPMYRASTRKLAVQFCSYGCRNKYYSGEKAFNWKGGSATKQNRYRERNRKRIREYKLRAVNQLGGKCSICGYSECIEALEFHHTNPLDKDFNIHAIISGGWYRIENELKKCILLCANCHRKVHHEQRINEQIVDRMPAAIQREE